MRRVTAESMTCSINALAPPGQRAHLECEQHQNKKWKLGVATDADSQLSIISCGSSAPPKIVVLQDETQNTY